MAVRAKKKKKLNFTYTLVRSKLAVTDQERDLGVAVKMLTECAAGVENANSMLGSLGKELQIKLPIL